MILDIIKYDNDPKGTLRKNNIDVKNNEHSKKLISDMFETLNVSNGIGLAAPQVGKNLKLFIVLYNDFNEVFINPKIFPYGYNKQMEESCLSLPNIPISVIRKEKIRIEYYNRKWQLQQKEFDGLLSRIIQHEYEHLISKLIIDY